jgi:spore maturation protein CgeB
MSGLSFVFLGLSITSSWGNGHATTYRALLRELDRRGHSLRFLERNLDFYAQNRDLPQPHYAPTQLYDSVTELRDRYSRTIREADVVIVGSYVPDGIEVCDWVLETAPNLKLFYDIDTPITVRKLEEGGSEYVEARQLAKFDMYLSFTGGPTLGRIARQFGLRAAKPLYCSVDPELYYPESKPERWHLGYLGTYSADRQPALQELLLKPAAAMPKAPFVVAGPQYPSGLQFPPNVERIQHLAPAEHRAFYNSQRYTLNITRADMVAAGYSPSVRLFEAAACGTPIISDAWSGLETFFEPEREIILARDEHDVRARLAERDDARREIGRRARRRILAEHTAAHRAETLESYVRNLTRPGHSSTAWRSSEAEAAPTPDLG